MLHHNKKLQSDTETNKERGISFIHGVTDMRKATSA